MFKRILAILILIFSAQVLAANIMDECSKSSNTQLDMSNCLANKAKNKDKEMENKLIWLHYNLNNILRQDYKDKVDKDTINEDKQYTQKQITFIQKAKQKFSAYRETVCQGIVDSYPDASFQYSGTMYYWCRYSLTESFLNDLEKLYFPEGWQSDYAKYQNKGKNKQGINHGHAK